MKLEYEKGRGASFVRESSGTYNLKHAETSKVKYDLVGKVAEGTTLRRKTVGAILAGLRIDRLYMFRNNLEEFITKVVRLINEQKVAMIVEHISYDSIEGKYDSSIFTAEKDTQSFDKAFLAKRSIPKIMYLRMDQQKRAWSVVSQRIWMQQKRYVYMQSFQEHSRYLHR